jgi:hypothetical protein
MRTTKTISVVLDSDHEFGALDYRDEDTLEMNLKTPQWEEVRLRNIQMEVSREEVIQILVGFLQLEEEEEKRELFQKINELTEGV